MNNTMLHPEVAAVARFSGRSRLEKAINSLLGILEGIALDRKINDREIEFINGWLREHDDVSTRHPFNELVATLNSCLEDGELTEEESRDIKWLCERLRAAEYTNSTTADLQRLHAILGGVASDGEVNEEEVRRLADWLEGHEHLKTCWPYDEIDSLVTDVMRDGKVDAEEHAVLRGYFSEFVHKLDDRTITNPAIQAGTTIVGLCAVCPQVDFPGATFCFTGVSARLSRQELFELVSKLGGRAVTAVSPKVNYLVVGSEGNPCWAYACYGRKVEEAVALRKAGSRIVILHENDFHDAIAGR